MGIEHVSCEAIPFAVEDPEVITKDRQRIAITIGGDVLRSCDKEFIEETWRQFQKIYLEDDVVLHRMGQIAIQAVKSCVGDYDADAILEGSNTDIESCIDENLNWLAEAYGLRVENVSIREVALTSEPDTSK